MLSSAATDEKKQENDLLTLLHDARKKLVDFWEKILPLSAKNKYDKAYAINEPTFKKLLADESNKESFHSQNKNYNPYELSETQHKDLAIVLSVLIQIVDDLIDGHLEKPRLPVDKEWKPLQKKDNMVFYSLYFEDYQQKDSKESPLKKIDVAFHVENNARVLGKFKNDKEERVIEVIEAGEPRARSILDTLITLFIKCFTAVTEIENNFSAVQNFCDLLFAADEQHSCINARIRMAMDDALSNNMGLYTFSKLLEKAINQAHIEFKEKTSFYYILAVLIRNFWNEPFKQDTGENAIRTKPGKMDIFASNDIFNGIQKITLQDPELDVFFDAYSIIPLQYQTDFWQLVTNQKNFVEIINQLPIDKLQWLLEEAGIQWNKLCSRAIKKRLDGFLVEFSAFVSNEILSALFLSIDKKEYLKTLESNAMNVSKGVPKLHWRIYDKFFMQKSISEQEFRCTIDFLRTYISNKNILRLILQANIIPSLITTPSNENIDKIKQIYHVINTFIESEEYKLNYHENQKILDKLITLHSPQKNETLLKFLEINCKINTTSIIQKMSGEAVALAIQQTKGIIWGTKPLKMILNKIDDITLLKKIFSDSNHLWVKYRDNNHFWFKYNLNIISKKLNNSKDLMDIIDSNHILPLAMDTLENFKVCLKELKKYLTPSQLLQLIHREKIIMRAKEHKESDSILLPIVKCLKSVAELKEIDEQTQNVFNELIQIPHTFNSKPTNILGFVGLHDSHDSNVTHNIMKLIHKDCFLKTVVDARLYWHHNGFKVILNRLNVDETLALLGGMDFYGSDDYRKIHFNWFTEHLNIIANKVKASLKTVLANWEIKSEELFESVDKMEQLRKSFDNPIYFLQLVEEANIIPGLVAVKSDVNTQKLQIIKNALLAAADREDADYQIRDVSNQLLSKLITYPDGYKSNLLGYFILESQENVSLMQKMSADVVAASFQSAALNFGPNSLTAFLDKLASPNLIKETLKNSNQLWKKNRPDHPNSFKCNLRVIAEKLQNPQYLLEIIEYNHILPLAAKVNEELLFCLEEISHYLSPSQLLQLIHRENLLCLLRDNNEENYNKFKPLLNCLKQVSELKEIDSLTQVAFDSLLETPFTNNQSNFLGVITLNLEENAIPNLVKQLSRHKLPMVVKEANLLWGSFSLDAILSQLDRDTSIMLLGEIDKPNPATQIKLFTLILTVIFNRIGFNSLITVLQCWGIKLQDLFYTVEQTEVLSSILNPKQFLFLIDNADIISNLITENSLVNNLKLQIIKKLLDNTSSNEDQIIKEFNAQWGQIITTTLESRIEFPILASFGNIQFPAIFNFSSLNAAELAIRRFCSDDKLIPLKENSGKVQAQFTVEACKLGYIDKLISLYPTQNPEAKDAILSLSTNCIKLTEQPSSSFTAFFNKRELKKKCQLDWHVFSSKRNNNSFSLAMK